MDIEITPEIKESVINHVAGDDLLPTLATILHGAIQHSEDSRELVAAAEDVRDKLLYAHQHYQLDSRLRVITA